MDEKMESSGRPDYLSMHESASVSGNVGKAPCFSLRLLLVCFLSLISKRLLVRFYHFLGCLRFF
jgi:hypothetical protein